MVDIDTGWHRTGITAGAPALETGPIFTSEVDEVAPDLLSTEIKFSTIILGASAKQFKASGIEFSRLSTLPGDELIEKFLDLKVDVDLMRGDKIRVFCESLAYVGSRLSHAVTRSGRYTDNVAERTRHCTRCDRGEVEVARVATF